MQRNNENTSLDSQNVDQESPSRKNRIREETRPSPGNTEKPSLVLAIQRNPAQSWQYKETQLSTSNTEYEKKPGIVPAIQRNPAFGPGNIEYEIAVASGVFIWRDVEVRRKRKEKKPHIQLKAVKRGQDGVNNQGTNSHHAIISTKNTQSNPESSIAFASPHKPV